jgi:glycosyltransferase involved in cell wall biosynthesis
MKQPVLTVLMPVYNSEMYVAEAIDSILNQTLTAFDFIIIDDASTDNSRHIIRSYNDSRIKFYQNTVNLGISGTLNKGLQLATTELVARMDADDISYPERLQKQYEYMAANPDCALLSCWTRVIAEDKRPLRIENLKSGHYYYNLTFVCSIYHPTVIYKRSCVLALGGYTQRYSEDYALFWELSRNYKIHNLDEILLDYRTTRQSLHQVTRKDEYEKAQNEQVLRSIRFYIGPGVAVRDSHLACLRHDFEPLLRENSVQSVIDCLRQLAMINQKIFETPAVNYDLIALKQAAFHKHRYILTYYVNHFTWLNTLLLLLRTGSWSYSYSMILRSLKNWLKKQMQ